MSPRRERRSLPEWRRFRLNRLAHIRRHVARDTPAVSHADVETLRLGYEAFSRGDWDDATRFAHPEFELQTADRVVNPGTYRGRDVARRFFEDLFEPFEEVVAEPEEFFERGDQIAVFVVTRLRPAGSSAVIENRVGHLWTMREGKAARLEVFPKREDALEAAGSPPAGRSQ